MAEAKTGGEVVSPSPSTPLTSAEPKPVACYAPRMLTPAEIVALRQNKRETAAIVKRYLAGK